MRAIVCPKYRPPDVLQLQEIEKSIVEPNEVLVKVHAASVNALDWRTVRASPFLVRLMGGFWKPKRPRLGVDFAGQVEALGPNATEFHSDDELFGRAYGYIRRFRLGVGEGDRAQTRRRIGTRLQPRSLSPV